MRGRWPFYLNAVFGSAVVTFGFWIVWGELSPFLGVHDTAAQAVWTAVAAATAVFLLWRAGGIGEIWAWATLLLGIESLAWPLAIMIEVRLSGAPPTDAQMGRILVAVLFGLFSSIFWLTFAYGIFRWTRRKAEPVRPAPSDPRPRRT